MAQRITINLHTGNAAFDGTNSADEVSRILRDLADRIERDCDDDGIMCPRVLRDVNGNVCGSVTVKPAA